MQHVLSHPVARPDNTVNNVPMLTLLTEWPFSSQCKIPWLFAGLLPMPHLPVTNPKPCFHLLHQLYSHYYKCSLHKHIHNDVVSWLSALLAFILQVFKPSNWLKKGKVTVTAFLLARLYYQYGTLQHIVGTQAGADNFRVGYTPSYKGIFADSFGLSLLRSMDGKTSVSFQAESYWIVTVSVDDSSLWADAQPVS